MRPLLFVAPLAVAAALAAGLASPAPRVARADHEVQIAIDTAMAIRSDDPQAAGEIPDAADCRVEPRPTEEIAAMWQARAATPQDAAPPSSRSVPAPIGAPADPAIAAEIAAVAREALACSNALDIARWLALFSDDFAAEIVAYLGFGSEADLRALLEQAPTPRLPSERVRLLAVTDASVMADGRVGVLVVYDDPIQPPEGVETEFGILEQANGRWLIDDIIEFTVIEDTASGTPTP